jgi:hypothetical protein
MPDKKVITAILVVIAVLLIAAAAWYYAYRYHTHLVANIADGGTVTLACQAGQHIKVVTAAYTPPKAKAADVAAPLQTILGALGGASFIVSGSALGQPPGGKLTFRYRCEAPSGRAGFRPIAVSTCGQPIDNIGPRAVSTCNSPFDDGYYGADLTGRNAAGTVVWDPWSTQSRVSLQRWAESPEVAEKLNPFTGVGKTSSLRALSDRYRRNENLARLSMYELQPGEPGFMIPVVGGEMSLLSQVSHRSPPAAIGAGPCWRPDPDFNPDFLTDGPFGEAVLYAL